MMTFDVTQMRALVATGHLTETPDPRGTGLSIFNYTELPQFTRQWSPYTLAARGLVLGTVSGGVYARPFDKFFNLGDVIPGHRGGSIIADEKPELFEKYDGSLIILFHDGNEYRVITRGAWESPQAVLARGMLSEFIASRPDPNLTFMFELIGPDNRHVVMYPANKLILIGVRDRVTGEEYDPEFTVYAEKFGFSHAKSYGTLDVAKRPPMGNNLREGYVARWPNGHRVKIKFDEYVTAHKIVHGASVKGIWERLQDGHVDLPPGLPDEFMHWYRAESSKIQAEYYQRVNQVETYFRLWPPMPTRKETAERWKDVCYAWMLPCMFAKLDGRPYDHIIWKQLEPKVEK